MTFSPQSTKVFCVFFSAERENMSAREKETGGEAEHVGSQASGSTYRMSVVNVHTAGHESAQTHTHARTHKLKCKLPRTFPQACYRLITEEPTQKVKHQICFSHTHTLI